MDNNTSARPLVSVIVPVHNAGSCLRYMMDCLVFQTLDNIEIIAVENSSTDGSLEVLKEYEAKYSGKVFVKTIPATTGPAPGRNEGLKYARADYIYMCDADDYLEYTALEKAYSLAVQNNYDIVSFEAEFINGDQRSILGKVEKGYDINKFVFAALPTFWSKLIHRSLYEKMGEIPNVTFDDVSYILPLCTYAKKIGQINEPLYHYFRRESSCANDVRSVSVILNSITAEKIALEKCDQQFREAVLAHICGRIVSNIHSRWVFCDLAVAWLKELWEEISQSAFITSQAIYKRLTDIVNNAQSPFAKNVFLNGFSKEYSDSEIKEIRKAAFYETENVIVLNADTCNINESPLIKEAYDQGNYRFVAGYFALKEIYEHGGIFLDTDVTVDCSFGAVRMTKCFFGYIDNETISDHVFGAQPGNPTIAAILDTYSGAFYPERFYPLCDRIKNILCAVERIPLNGMTDYKNYNVTMFAPEILSVDAYKLCSHNYDSPFHLSHLDFSGFSDCVTIPSKTLLNMLGIMSGGAPIGNPTELNLLRRRVKTLEQELNSIKNSRSWKLASFMKRLATGRLRKPLIGLYNLAKKIRSIFRKK